MCVFRGVRCLGCGVGFWVWDPCSSSGAVENNLCTAYTAQETPRMQPGSPLFGSCVFRLNNTTPEDGSGSELGFSEEAVVTSAQLLPRSRVCGFVFSQLIFWRLWWVIVLFCPVLK